MKIKILLTVYNDWENLKEVSVKIYEALKNTKWKNYELVIINDGSRKKYNESLDFSAKYTVINLLNNQGNQKAIAIGLKYCLEQSNNFEHLVILDSDGEDKPEDIPRLLSECENNKSEKIVFAKRSKRNENLFFLFLYNIYKFIFKTLTKNELDFGNFSCIPARFIKRIVSIVSLQFHYSGSVIKSKIPIAKIDCEKGKRVHGNSTMGLNRKLHHSLMSLSLFAEEIAIKSFFGSIAAMLLIILISSLILIIRITSDLLIVGWTSNFLLSLLIIFIVLLLVSLFSLIVLIINKSNSSLSGSNFEIKNLIEDISEKNIQ